MQRVGQQCRAGAVQVVDHARSVTRRLLELSRAAKSQTAQGKARLTASYGKLVALTRRVTRQATRGRRARDAGPVGARHRGRDA